MDEQAEHLSSDEEFDGEESEEDYGEDDEGTLDEEEEMASQDLNPVTVEAEIADLLAESEMNVEDLRAMYAQPTTSAMNQAASSSADKPSTSKMADELDRLSPTRGPSILSSLFTDEFSDHDDNDKDYKPTDRFNRIIRVGDDYQATNIPPYQPDANAEQESDHADPLWIPPDEAVIPHDTLVNHLRERLEQRRTSGDNPNYVNVPGVSGSRSNAQAPLSPSATLPIIPDDEDLLFALMRHNFSIEDAAREPFPLTPANPPRLTYQSCWHQFSAAECGLFEEGMLIDGKDFFQIRKNRLKNRKVGELVRFYYSWKNTERRDAFMQKLHRLSKEKKAKKILSDESSKNVTRETSHQSSKFYKYIDPMDIVLDEMIEEGLIDESVKDDEEEEEEEGTGEEEGEDEGEDESEDEDEDDSDDRNGGQEQMEVGQEAQDEAEVNDEDEDENQEQEEEEEEEEEAASWPNGMNGGANSNNVDDSPGIDDAIGRVSSPIVLATDSLQINLQPPTSSFDASSESASSKEKPINGFHYNRDNTSTDSGSGRMITARADRTSAH